MSGWEPNLLRLSSAWSMGILPPMCPASGISPWGVSRSAAPYFGILWDNTSMSSVGRGEEAVGSEFIAESLRDPSEEDTSGWDLAGLHMHVWHYNYEVKSHEKYYRVRILTISPGACPWAATPPCCRRRVVE